MKWYLKCFRQYIDFSGRSRRKEYWMFILFNMIIYVVLSLVDGLLGRTFGVFGGIYSLAVFLPSLAVCVRRLHDIGKSGWNVFLALIPLVGAIILIVWFCQDGENGDNSWGANPKAE